MSFADTIFIVLHYYMFFWQHRCNKLITALLSHDLHNGAHFKALQHLLLLIQMFYTYISLEFKL